MLLTNRHFLIIFILVALIIIGGFVYLRIVQNQDVVSPSEEGGSTGNELTDEQMIELDALRQEAGFGQQGTSSEPVVQEEPEAPETQIEELDLLRQQAEPQPLNQEEIDKQLEDMDNLRAQSQ